MNFRIFINLFTLIFYCCVNDKNDKNDKNDDQTYEHQIDSDVNKILSEKRPNFQNKQKDQEYEFFSFLEKLKEQKEIEEIKKKDHIFGKKEDFENSKNFSKEQKERVQEAQNENFQTFFYKKANFYKIFDIESDDSKPTIHCCENAKIILKKQKDTVEILSEDGIFYLSNRLEESKKIVHHDDQGNFIFVSKPISNFELQKLLESDPNKSIIIIDNKFLNLENITQEDKNRIHFGLKKQGDNILYLSFEDFLEIEDFKKKEKEKLNKEMNLLDESDEKSFEEYLKNEIKFDNKIKEMINSKKNLLK